jgi:hypothetical protein
MAYAPSFRCLWLMLGTRLNNSSPELEQVHVSRKAYTRVVLVGPRLIDVINTYALGLMRAYSQVRLCAVEVAETKADHTKEEGR